MDDGQRIIGFDEAEEWLYKNYNKSLEELSQDKARLKKSELKMMLPPTKTDLT